MQSENSRVQSLKPLKPLSNGKKAIGVLKKITPDHKLDIRGDYTQWVVDPEEIVDFTARVDRHNKREGEKHQ